MSWFCSLRVALDRFERLPALRGIQLAALQQVQPAEDGTHRRSQLVR